MNTVVSRCGFTSVVQELAPGTYQFAILRDEEIVQDGISTGSREVAERIAEFLLTGWIAVTPRPLPVSNDTAGEALAA